jgi:hypothetical protein
MFSYNDNNYRFPAKFYLAPGLQYIVSQRFMLEASYQLPVLRNTGALVLCTDSNFLFGFSYLH